MPLCRLNARSVIRTETFAGTRGNGQDAPFPVVRRAATEPRGRVVSSHSPTLIILVDNNVVARVGQGMIRLGRRSDEVRRCAPRVIVR